MSNIENAWTVAMLLIIVGGMTTCSVTLSRERVEIKRIEAQQKCAKP